MMLKIPTLISILSLLSVAVKSQNGCNCPPADKLRPQIGFFFNTGKLDSAAITLGKLAEDKNEVCRIVYLDGMAQVNVAKEKFDEARSWFAKEQLLQDKLQCKRLQIRFYNSLARYYQAVGFSDSITIYSLKVIGLAEEEKDWYAAARACTNLAAVFQQQKQTEKCLEYNLKALPYARKSNDTVILNAVLARTAHTYFLKYEATQKSIFLDSLFLLASECIALSRSNMPSLMERSDAYSLLSKFYIKQSNYAKAILYADTAITICPPGVYDFYRHLLNGYQRKSEAYLQQKNYIAARQMADSAYRYAQLFNLQLAITPLETIFTVSKQLKDFERSSAALERISTLKDSMFSVEKNKAINELEKKYNQAKNENTIKELAQQKQIYGLLAIAGLLALVAIGFWVRQLSLKHKQKILETEQRLNRARMNPHFFFNALSTLHSFAVREKDPGAIASNLSKFSHIMRETLESTYKEYVTVEQEMDFLNEYLDVQQRHSSNTFEYSVTADKQMETDEMIIPSMIIQPFVENSIEHGFAGIDYTGIIQVQFSKKEKSLEVTITDNGAGLISSRKQSGEHISRANQIIKDRIYLLNIKLKTKASFSIDNATDGKGVLVKIHLPLLYINDIKTSV
jgi:anti-sigma regulatory factor (Ser/Thr protein kinase)